MIFPINVKIDVATPPVELYTGGKIILYLLRNGNITRSYDS